MIFSPATGVVVTRTGAKPAAITGALTAALGFYLSSTATSYSAQLAYMFVVGAGLATVNASIVNLLVLAVDPRKMGLATSMNSVFRNLGSSLGAPVAGSLLSTFTTSVAVSSVAGRAMHKTIASVQAFQFAFYAAAIAFVALALVVPFAHEVLGERKATWPPRGSQTAQPQRCGLHRVCCSRRRRDEVSCTANGQRTHHH